MTIISNSIHKLVHETTTLLPLVKNQISKNFLANIASLRNTPLSLNRHGNTFQGMITSSPATLPDAIKNVHSTAAPQITAEKTPLYNRQGNTYQGMIVKYPLTDLQCSKMR